MTIIEHRHGRCRRRVVAQFQNAARRSSQSQRVEEVSGNQLTADHARRTIPGQCQRTCVGKRRHSRELVCIPDLAKHRLGKRAPGGICRAEAQIAWAIARRHVTVNPRRLARAPSQHDQLRGLFDRQRAQHHRINQAENGCVGANSQRERKNSNSGEARRITQHAQAVADVLPQFLDPGDSPHVTRIFLHSHHVPEFTHRRIARFFRSHPALDVVLRFSLNVLANVSIELFQYSPASPHDAPSLPSRPENPRYRSRQFVPLAGFHFQLFPAFPCQAVKLGPPVVLRSALFHRNPSPLDEPVQRRIQRSLLDLQHFVGVEFDCFGDGVAVRRAA